MFELVAGALLETLLGEAVGVLAGRAKQAKLSRDEKKRIQRIGREVAEGIQPLFEHETARWPDHDVGAVITEAAHALTRVPLTKQALILEDKFDPTRLVKRLRAGYTPVAFSSDQRAVYERVLVGLSEAIMRAAREVAGYEEARDHFLVQGQATIHKEQLANAKAIGDLSGRDEREADATEAAYRRAVQSFLDRMELFGVPQVDPLHRHQSLSVSFITLRVEGEWGADEGEWEGARWRERGQPSDESLAHSHSMRHSGPADEVLARLKRVVIVGKPGSGKSTLLRWRYGWRGEPALLPSKGGRNLCPSSSACVSMWRRGFPCRVSSPNSLPRRGTFLRGGRRDGWTRGGR